MEGCVICSKLEGGHEKVHTKQRVNLITRTDIVTSQVFHVCVGTLDLCRFFVHVPRNHRNIWSELRTPFKTKLIMLRSKDAIQNAPP